MNTASIVWAVVTVLLGILEGATAGLIAVWFALGALVAFVVSLFGAGLPVQLLAFLVVSLVALVATRPLVNKVLKVRRVPTNADSLVGQRAVVTEALDSLTGKGRVKAGGLSWKAALENGGQLSEGAVVKVIRIEGAKLIVERQMDETAVSV